jgi:hypothetical protein
MPNAPSSAVLGFRPHTYWTSAVALAGPPDAPRVIERRRIPFAAGEERMVFHRAEQTDLDSARVLIEEVRAATEANAAREIGQFIADLRRDDVSIRIAVVPEAINKLPDNLEDILKVHARMHAAEGNFYRGVVASACGVVGLQVHRVVERELPALVGDLLDANASAVEARLKAMGAKLGPPWSEDYKLATLAAWLHLDDTDEEDRP